MNLELHKIKKSLEQIKMTMEGAKPVVEIIDWSDPETKKRFPTKEAYLQYSKENPDLFVINVSKQQKPDK